MAVRPIGTQGGVGGSWMRSTRRLGPRPGFFFFFSNFFFLNFLFYFILFFLFLPSSPVPASGTIDTFEAERVLCPRPPSRGGPARGRLRDFIFSRILPGPCQREHGLLRPRGSCVPGYLPWPPRSVSTQGSKVDQLFLCGPVLFLHGDLLGTRHRT